MKKALIIGINDYPTAPLQGCVNDAYDYQARLQAKGFTCTLLLNSQATKANILAGINSLVSGVASGDSIALCYSGHGSQVTDSSGDETDNKDEVLCPANWPQYVSDDDLRSIFAGLPSGVTLDCFLDCCHSGTGTRDINQIGTIRSLPPIVGKRSKKKSKTKTIVLVPTLNHILWAGCEDGQTSTELSINGIPRGAFSYYVGKALASTGGTRSQMINYVCTKVAALGLSQIPQLEATQAETLQAPFT
ncbi:caspase family protein [Candidatus Pacearchaeota archaeon]|jgi:hypothetical protein|nr:caspase family protein [Candidatus Pacearchaeota archaeon]